MRRINVLSKDMANLIAAGEVVERPASVVKELMENAIDAGSDKITVEIKNGGMSMIKISDNGSGIHKEDVKIAFLRHATSKIQNPDDLFSIKTLGFRGEALSSICAVSRVEIVTSQGGNLGVRYVIEGGEERIFEDAGRAKGTTITVKDLFFNTPARMKFLKKDVAEANLVSSVVDKIAMSNPNVAVKFIRDGKITVNTPGDGKLASCVYSIYGKDIFEKMLPVDYKLNGIDITGFVSMPELSRPSRAMQNFFINKRFAKIMIASTALEEAFKGSLMVGKHPICAVYINTPFETVDVNVHPAKTEVRFINERPIFEAVYNGVCSALMKNRKIKEMKFEKTKLSLNSDKTTDEKKLNTQESFLPFSVKKENIEENFTKDQKNEDKNLPNYGGSVFDMKLSDIANFNFYKKEDFPKKSIDIDYEQDDLVENKEDKPEFLNFGEEVQNKNFENPDIKKPENVKESHKKFENNKQEDFQIKIFEESNEGKIKILGEIFDCYILIQKADRLLFIDKHAAHERIIYNKLKDAKNEPDLQMLLSPVVVHLDKESHFGIISNLDILQKSGYKIEDFGNSSVIVRSVPANIDVMDVEESIAEIAYHIVKNKSDLSTKNEDWIYHNVACRAAIKAGKSSSYDEILDLVKKLQENPDVKYCPHGRPVYIELRKKDIEKQFGRS